MKKRVLSLLCVVMLISVFCMPAYAENSDVSYVVDEAGILEESEAEELEARAQELSSSYDCGVYIFTVDNFTEYTSTSDVYEAAKELFFSNDLGIGDEDSGVLLLLSMADRDFCVMAHGYGNTAFTDRGKEELSDQFLDDFKDDDWYSGFSDYLSACQEMLIQANNGTPVDVDNPLYGSDTDSADSGGSNRVFGVIFCIGISILITIFVSMALKRQMKSVEEKAEASSYVKKNGVVLTDSYDRYTHTTESRRYDPPEKSSGGGTSVDSSGSSGSSGKF